MNIFTNKTSACWLAAKRFVLAFFVLSSAPAWATGVPAAGKGHALADALLPNGTLRPGSSGSFDATGYRLAHDPLDGHPVFRPMQTAGVNDENWDSRFGGRALNSDVYALLVAPNGDLIVGGSFTNAFGNLDADNVARWNGNQWSAIGAGLAGQVRALAFAANGDIVAGGDFTNGVMRWNGAAWQSMGPAVGNMGAVQTLAVARNGDIIAGVRYGGVIRYTGTQWQVVGTLLMDVKAVVILPNGDIVAGGGLNSLSSVSKVVRWNGSQWLPLGSGIYSNPADEVRSLAVAPNGDVVVGGNFVTPGTPTTLRYVVRWNGSSWVRVVLCGIVNALAYAANGDLLVGGDGSNGVFRSDGVYTVRFGTGVSGGEVFALAERPGGDVLAGGNFTSIGGSNDPNTGGIAGWDGSRWFPLAPGLWGDGAVVRIAVANAVAVAPNGDVYVGGAFSQVSGVGRTSYLARWTGAVWQSVGGGLNGPVKALTLLSNGDLIAGGNFTNAGGNPNADRLARWNGTRAVPRSVYTFRLLL